MVDDDAEDGRAPDQRSRLSATGMLAGSDWPAQAADLVERTVGSVHDKVVRPLLLVARALVFGLLVATMALAVAVLGSIAVVRLLDSYAFGHRVWASDLVVGGFFTLIGLGAWSRRRAGEER